jgi:hypothetical protein
MTIFTAEITGVGEIRHRGAELRQVATAIGQAGSSRDRSGDRLGGGAAGARSGAGANPEQISGHPTEGLGIARSRGVEMHNAFGSRQARTMGRSFMTSAAGGTTGSAAVTG